MQAKGGPQARHRVNHFVPVAGRADLSSSRELQPFPRGEVVPISTAFAGAKRSASPNPTGRSRHFLQKESLPYIRKVQHTVLFVAGLKGTMSEAELHVLPAR